MTETTVRCPLGCSRDYIAWNGVKSGDEQFICMNCHRRWSRPYDGPDPTPPPNRYILAADENQWLDELAAEIGDRINTALKGRWPR